MFLSSPDLHVGQDMFPALEPEASHLSYFEEMTTDSGPFWWSSPVPPQDNLSSTIYEEQGEGPVSQPLVYDFTYLTGDEIIPASSSTFDETGLHQQSPIPTFPATYATTPPSISWEDYMSFIQGEMNWQQGQAQFAQQDPFAVEWPAVEHQVETGHYGSPPEVTQQNFVVSQLDSNNEGASPDSGSSGSPLPAYQPMAQSSVMEASTTVNQVEQTFIDERGNRKYFCNICGKVVLWRRRQHHNIGHSPSAGRRVCYIGQALNMRCGTKGFSRKDSNKRHVRLVHAEYYELVDVTELDLLRPQLPGEVSDLTALRHFMHEIDVRDGRAPPSPQST